ncbi:MAG: 50S ribosomal protein L11 methyltransferase [Proteobacteria bacterium]|nr:50S ribosomal protein L11 methyltransferase [Pseudomonadota bacterium]
MSAQPPPTLWRLLVRSSAGHAPAYAAVLEGVSAAVSYIEDEDGAWRGEGYNDTPPDHIAITEGLGIAAGAFGSKAPELTIEILTPRDWLAENLASFPPIRLGRIFIHPGHFKGQVPAGAIALEIDAATAFGTGSHPTTASCIKLIEDCLATAPAKGPIHRALDMGCGSGLLAFAMAKLGAKRVVAVDIDPEAVRVARLNARINRIGGRVRIECGPGYRTDAVRDGGPYDLVAANVLARPLKAMAGDLARNLAPGGTAILSGLIVRDAADVAGMHRAHGLRLVRRLVQDGWATLEMRKRGRRPRGRP